MTSLLFKQHPGHVGGSILHATQEEVEAAGREGLKQVPGAGLPLCVRLTLSGVLEVLNHL